MALFTGVVGELSSQLSEYTPVAPATSAMVASVGALALGSVRTQAQQVVASVGAYCVCAPSTHTSWPPRWVQGPVGPGRASTHPGPPPPPPPPARPRPPVN